MKPHHEQEWLKVTDCHYKCWSHAFIEQGGLHYMKSMEDMMNMDIEHGVGIMMDSGAFSFHQMTKKKKTKSGKTSYQKVDDKTLLDETVRRYVKFIQRRGEEFDFFVNFDYVKDSKTVWDMQKRLEKMGIRPMPMYHGDSSIEWFRRYLEEGYDYIGLGSLKQPRSSWRAAQQFIDDVFNEIEKFEVRGRKIWMHGFGRTSYALMWGWPWGSVDSSTWARVGGHGRILIPTSKKITMIHVSNRGTTSGHGTHGLEKTSLKHIEKFVEARGFDLGKLRESKHQRDLFNGFIFSHINDFKQAYLERRGEKTKWETLL